MKKSAKLISLIMSLALIVSSLLVPTAAYAQNTYVKGVDISEHNGDVDFNVLKSQGYDFVMIRLGYSDKYLDKYFYQNIQKAAESGMKFGVYHYSYAYNTAEAQAEANFVVSTLNSLDPYYKQNMVLPVAYDLEDKAILEKGNCGMTEITNNALTFCNTLKSVGYETMIYANDNWLKKYIDINQINANGIKIWYAYWTDTETSNIEYVKDTSIPCYMWQYQSGSYNSLNGLDQNVIYTNSMAFMKTSLSFTSATYDGYGKYPFVNVYDGSYQLTNGVDYTVSYTNNVNAGTGYVTLYGMGNYVGTATIPFAINPVKYSSSNTTVKLSSTKYTYNGKTRKPSVKVYDSYGNLLPSSIYSVKYTGNANPGKKKVTITFKGNYSGSITKYYNIIPKKQTLSSVKTTGKKKLKVTWKKDKTISGYQIQYSTSSKFTKDKKTITVSKSSTSKTIKTSKSNKKYYVRIRAYKTIDGKKVYGSWSSTKSVKVK